MDESKKSENLSTSYADGVYEAERLSRSRIMSSDDRKKLQEFAFKIATEHGFDDANSVYAFLMRMWKLMDTGSQVVLVDGKVQAPVDQPSFKPTRERLTELHSCLSRAIEILHEMPSNETLAASLHIADKTGAMDQQFGALLRLAETSERAASLTGRAGRPPNEDWVREFCIACQDFWKVNDRGGTSIDFRTEYPTPITRWVEDIYVGLRRLKGYRDDLPKLKSAAKDLPAYRGAKQTD